MLVVIRVQDVMRIELNAVEGLSSKADRKGMTARRDDGRKGK